MLKRTYYLKKRNKYGNKPKVVDGIRFDSIKEANYFIALKNLKAVGEIDLTIRQPQFDLGAGAKYRADFLNFWSDGRVTIEDVKSQPTSKNKDFILKKKLIEEKYGIIIDVII